MSSSNGTAKLGGRVGIVGTGHRARVRVLAVAVTSPSFSFLCLRPQLYTTAIAARPSSQLVALCDVNEERMKVHQNMLKELGQPEAKMYAGVSQWRVLMRSGMLLIYLIPY